MLARAALQRHRSPVGLLQPRPPPRRRGHRFRDSHLLCRALPDKRLCLRHRCKHRRRRPFLQHSRVKSFCRRSRRRRSPIREIRRWVGVVNSRRHLVCRPEPLLRLWQVVRRKNRTSTWPELWVRSLSISLPCLRLLRLPRLPLPLRRRPSSRLWAVPSHDSSLVGALASGRGGERIGVQVVNHHLAMPARQMFPSIATHTDSVTRCSDPFPRHTG